jgi:hypothetical protein
MSQALNGNRIREPQKRAAAHSRRVDEHSKATKTKPDGSYRVLVRLAHDVIDSDPNQSYVDQIEDLKIRAARYDVAYESNVVTRALEAARKRKAMG